MADRKPGAPPEGTILVNGEKIGPSYRRVAAYVMQSDVLFPRLTVRETLMYAAELRVPASVPLAEKTARVRPAHCSGRQCGCNVVLIALLCPHNGANDCP